MQGNLSHRSSSLLLCGLGPACIWKQIALRQLRKELTLPAFHRHPASTPGMAAALVYSLQGAWPARIRPTVTKGAVMRTPSAMLGTNGIPVAASLAYVMGASTSPGQTFKHS